MNLEKEKGLDIILHKLSNKDCSPLILNGQYKEIIEELNEVGKVFDEIHKFADDTFIFELEESYKAFTHLEFVIIKSVAVHIEKKYGIKSELKCLNPKLKKYFRRVKPLSMLDLLERCNKLLKNPPKLKLK